MSSANCSQLAYCLNDAFEKGKAPENSLAWRARQYIASG